MSGLYSPINRLAESITRPKGTGAEYLAELQKKPGYKPAEAQDRDLQKLMALPQMERAAFMEKLKGQANKFPLKMRELEDEQTHHGDYTMPGGENYREIMLHTTMPKGAGFPGVSHHFGGTPNIVASIRVKDRQGPQPGSKKILHLEEIQSDWHQQGREKGYVDQSKIEAAENQLQQLAQRRKELTKIIHDSPQVSNDLHEQYLNLKDQEEAAKQQLVTSKAGIPHGPHAKDWHELALKAMIQHAAENGYEQIAVTPGAEQARRYGLSQHVKALAYNPDTKYFVAQPHEGGHTTTETDLEPHDLASMVGKETAQKLLNSPRNEHGAHILQGQDLEVGGEGMKGFYDKMVPAFLNKFGKKYGTQVQPGSINTEQHKVTRDSHPTTPYRVSSVHSPDILSRHDQAPDAWRHAEELSQEPVHTFEITPEMRSDVLKNGIPRYDEGGIVSTPQGNPMIQRKAIGGPVTTLEQMKAQLMQRPNFMGLGQLQSVGINEAPGMDVKSYVSPTGPAGGGMLPVGGIDMNKMQLGQQMMPQQPGQPGPQGGQPPGTSGQPQGAPGSPGQPPQAGDLPPPQGQTPPNQGSNILQMTPQGQAMAAMRPSSPGMARGGNVHGYAGGNRVRPQFAIAPAVPVAKGPEHFTPYDHSNPTMKSLATAFDEAIAHHLSLSPEERAQNSIRAAEKVADVVGRTSNGTPKDLLGKNEKLLKSEAGYDGGKPVELPDGRGIETTGLALAPAYREGKFDTCPNHQSCKAECLGKTSGNYFKLGGGKDLEEFLGPRLNSLKKTHAFMHAPHDFAVKLHDEIHDAKAMAAQNGNHLGLRLNVLSDINPRVHKAIINAHPDVTFYDYTKNNTDPIASNHHYTYSSTGVSQPGVHNEHQNWKSMRRRLDQGDNVAMAFSDKHHLPEELHDQETGKRYKVVNGDMHDFRPLDLQPEGEDGVIVGLKNKKATGTTHNAHAESHGFFVHYDPQLQMAKSAKGQPVYARSKPGSKSMYDTIPQNRAVSIQPQARPPIQLTNDDGSVA